MVGCVGVPGGRGEEEMGSEGVLYLEQEAAVFDSWFVSELCPSWIGTAR
jgi:hypothetical protein